MARRIAMSLFPSQRPVRTVSLPWGAQIEVNARESIGRELLRQNIFDIAVSETAWRLLKPGDLAVDVGANIGYMTSLFAARVGPSGRVEAFEPHPRIFAQLERNAHSFVPASGAVRTSLRDIALGSRDGYALLIEPPVFGINEGTSTVARETVAPELGGGNGIEVRSARFDSLFPDERVELAKVDVEGFEGEVLAGAERALAQRRIHTIIYEAHDCERSGVHRMLTGFGYSLFGIGHDLFGPRLTPGSAAPMVDRAWESPSYLATLDPAGVQRALRTRGWQVLRAC
jgi:FkbM family methyltransferase